MIIIPRNNYGITICINNNTVINNNYGRLRDLILLFKFLWARALKNLRRLWSTKPSVQTLMLQRNVTLSVYRVPA